jgi:hypothetical protein
MSWPEAELPMSGSSLGFGPDRDEFFRSAPFRVNTLSAREPTMVSSTGSLKEASRAFVIVRSEYSVREGRIR